MAHSMPVHDEALFMVAMTENIQIGALGYILIVMRELVGLLKGRLWNPYVVQPHSSSQKLAKLAN